MTGKHSRSNSNNDSQPPHKKTKTRKSRRSTATNPVVGEIDDQDDVTGLRNSEKQHADQHRLEDVIKAIAKNPAGVRILKADSLRESQPALAGYLGLKDITELKQYLYAGHVSEKYLIPFKKAKDACFGLEKNLAVNVAKIFALIPVENEFFNDEDFNETLPLDHNRWTVHGKMRHLASWIITMHHLIKENPEMFPSSGKASEETRKKYLKHIVPEDWFRAYQILNHFTKALTDSKLDGGKDKHGDKHNDLFERVKKLKSKSEGSKKQSKDASPPDFYTDEDYERAKASKGRPMLPMGNVNELNYLQDALENDGYESSSEDETDDFAPLTENQAQSAIDRIEKDIIATSLRTAPTAHIRNHGDSTFAPWQTSTTMEVTCKSQGKSTRVLWPFGNEDPHPEVQEQEVNNFINSKDREFETEGVLGPAEDVHPQKQKEFWELQKTVNSRSARPKSYETSCTILNIDPKNCKLRKDHKICPYPWQVQGIVWLLEMLRSPNKCGLLADDVGLGKTITALATLSCAVEAAKENIRNPTHATSPMGNLALTGPYTPTVILCPSNALQVWQREIEDSFSEFTLFKYFGSSKKPDLLEKANILQSDVEELVIWASKFDKSDPSTALNLVLTSYSTWHSRTLFLEEGAQQKPRKLQNDIDDDDETEYTEEQVAKMYSKATDTFSLFIFDEAHKLKTVRTRTHQSVKLANPKQIIPLTATLTINKPSDLYGMLCLMEVVRVEAADMLPDDTEVTQKKYKHVVEELDMLPEGDIPNFEVYKPYLSSSNFRKFVPPGAHVDTVVASRIFPAIFLLVVLRRIKGESIDLGEHSIVIGGDVPRYNITTVELQMDTTQRKLYNQVHGRYKFTLSGGRGQNGESNDDGRINMASHRLLSHATLNVELDKFSGKGTTVQAVDKWHEKDDHGCTYYHQRTRPNPNVPPYIARQAALCYTVAQSPKMKWLLNKAYEVCFLKKTKLLIFCNWPLNQWYIEMCLGIADFHVLSVRSAHTVTERTATIHAFNDVKHDSQILVTSYRCSATSLNLQKACYHMVMVDVPESANTAMQAIGRIFRIHQTKEQQIWILTVDHTYDQVIQARSAKKMYGQIAGTASLKDVETAEVESASFADKERAKQAQLEATDKKVMRLYMAMLGQRSPRHKWTDVKSFTSKDTLPDEADFYQKLSDRKSERLKAREQAKPKKSTKVVNDDTSAVSNDPIQKG